MEASYGNKFGVTIEYFCQQRDVGRPRSLNVPILWVYCRIRWQAARDHNQNVLIYYFCVGNNKTKDCCWIWLLYARGHPLHHNWRTTNLTYKNAACRSTTPHYRIYSIHQKRDNVNDTIADCMTKHSTARGAVLWRHLAGKTNLTRGGLEWKIINRGTSTPKPTLDIIIIPGWTHCVDVLRHMNTDVNEL